jgi:hypothetical protein
MTSLDQRQLQAARRGDSITLRLLRAPELRAIVFDDQAPLLDRMLAAAASGVLRPGLVEATVQSSPEMRQAVIDLADAQVGDVTIGHVAARDVITINVYVGTNNE